MVPLRRVVTALAIMAAAAGAAAQTATPMAGDWNGSYRCAQGLTALHLNVDAAPDGTLSAVFAFSAVPSANEVPSGSFQMHGTFEPASQTAILQPGAWLVRPDGYVTVGLAGKLECSGMRFRGRITGGFFCSTFELYRPGAPRCEGPTPISSHVEPMLDLTKLPRFFTYTSWTYRLSELSMPELFTIGELAAAFSLSPRAIRFYEDQGLLAPERVGTQRVYTRRDRARLQLILRGKRLGFSISDIREFLDLYHAESDNRRQMQVTLERTSKRIADLEQQLEDITLTLSELRDLQADITRFLAEPGQQQRETTQ